MAVAALLPCFWIYWEVGKHLLGTAGPDNPYQSWIDIYADEAFADGVRKAIAISDQIADAASAPVRDRISAHSGARLSSSGCSGTARIGWSAGRSDRSASVGYPTVGSGHLCLTVNRFCSAARSAGARAGIDVPY
jgi:hypothetical protein